MTEATRKVHGKSPDKRFALVRPLFQRGLKDDIHNHNAVIPAKAGTQCLRRDNWVPAFAGMTMRFDDAFHRVIARELPHP